MRTRESAALDRRIAELRRELGVVEIVRRSAQEAIVRIHGECILLDGRRLVADPRHKGLRLSGPDLELRAQHAGPQIR